MLSWQVQHVSRLHRLLEYIGCGLPGVRAGHVVERAWQEHQLRCVQGWQVLVPGEHEGRSHVRALRERQDFWHGLELLFGVFGRLLCIERGQRVHGLPGWHLWRGPDWGVHCLRDRKVLAGWGDGVLHVLGVRDRPVQRVQLHQFS